MTDRPYKQRRVPAHLCHRIIAINGKWELRTHYGHVLRTFKTATEAHNYYARHCAGGR